MFGSAEPRGLGGRVVVCLSGEAQGVCMTRDAHGKIHRYGDLNYNRGKEGEGAVESVQDGKRARRGNRTRRVSSSGGGGTHRIVGAGQGRVIKSNHEAGGEGSGRRRSDLKFIRRLWGGKRK